MFSIRGYLRQIIFVSLVRQRKTATPAYFPNFPEKKNNNFLKMAVFPTYVPIVKKYSVWHYLVL